MKRHLHFIIFVLILGFLIALTPQGQTLLRDGLSMLSSTTGQISHIKEDIKAFIPAQIPPMGYSCDLPNDDDGDGVDGVSQVLTLSREGSGSLEINTSTNRAEILPGGDPIKVSSIENKGFYGRLYLYLYEQAGNKYKDISRIDLPANGTLTYPVNAEASHYTLQAYSGTGSALIHFDSRDIFRGSYTIHELDGRKNLGSVRELTGWPDRAGDIMLSTEPLSSYGGATLEVPFNDDPVTQNDESGNNYNGTMGAGAAYTDIDCVIGGCMDLPQAASTLQYPNNIHEYIDFGNADLFTAGSFTLQAWVKPDAGMSAGKFFLHYVNGSSYIDVSFGPGSTSDKSDITWKIYGSQSTWGGGQQFQTTSTVSNDVWSHIALVYKAPTTGTFALGSLNAYTNGVTPTTASIIYTESYSQSTQTRLGAPFNNYSGLQPYKGKVDELQIYPFAATSAQLLEYYEATNPSVSRENYISAGLGAIGTLSSTNPDIELVICKDSAGGWDGTCDIDQCIADTEASLKAKDQDNISVQIAGTEDLGLISKLKTGDIYGLAPNYSGVYDWAVDGSPFTEVNLPFNSGSDQIETSSDYPVSIINTTETNGYGSVLEAKVESSGCIDGSCISVGITYQPANVQATQTNHEDRAEVDVQVNNVGVFSENQTVEFWAKRHWTQQNYYGTIRDVPTGVIVSGKFIFGSYRNNPTQWWIGGMKNMVPYSSKCGMNSPNIGFGYLQNVYGSQTNDSAWNIICSNKSFNDTDWHHYVGVLNGATMSLYLDGVLQGSTAFTKDSVTGGKYTHVEIGGGYYYDTNVPGFIAYKGTFHGLVDEVKVYHRALSAAQIEQNYIEGLGGNSGPILIVGDETLPNQAWTLSFIPYQLSGPLDLSKSLASNTVSIPTIQVNTFFPAAKELSPVTLSQANGGLSTDLSLTANTIGAFNWEMDSGSGADIPTSLHLPFDGDYLDSSLNQNATIVDIVDQVFGGGVEGQAAALNGVGDYLRVTEFNNSLTLGPGLTISAWINPNALRDKTAVLSKVALGLADDSDYAKRTYVAGINADGSMTMHSAAEQEWKNSNPGIVPIAAWTHVAWIWDGVKVKFYVNGIHDSSIPMSLTDTQAHRVYIGRWHDTNTAFSFSGNIDDVQVFKQALSGAQIRELMAGGTAQTTLDNLMALNMPFNSGELQIDFSNNGYDGYHVGNTYYGSLGGRCRVGGCLNFNGSSDFVDLEAGRIVDGKDNISLSVWINPRSTDGYRPIFNKENTFKLGLSDGALHYSMGAGHTYSLGGSIPTGEWSHVVLVKEGTTVRVYLNNSLIDPSPTTLTAPATLGTSSNDNFIAKDEASPIGYFDGYIDEVQIYNRALSVAQIAQVNNDGLRGIGGPSVIVNDETNLDEKWQVLITPIAEDLDAVDPDYVGVIGATVISNALTVGPPPPTCPNNFKDIDEICDGSDLAGETCESKMGAGYTGNLACAIDCLAFDTSACAAPTCPNGTIDTELGEICDGTNFAGETCETQRGPGYTGTLACTDCMSIDSTGCTLTCPNGTIDTDLGEVCDGSNFAGETCENQMGAGYTGNLACATDCLAFDTSDCVPPPPPPPTAFCGDNTVQKPNDDSPQLNETCDGIDLDNNACTDLGFTGGTLACASDCTDFDVTGCTGTPTANCGDVLEEGEACDDGNAISDDGCTFCAVDPGYNCTGNIGEVSVCATTTSTTQCGNFLEVGEDCDDGNSVSNDGCTFCSEDPGYNCIGNIGEVSVCALRPAALTLPPIIDEVSDILDTYDNIAAPTDEDTLRLIYDYFDALFDVFNP